MFYIDNEFKSEKKNIGQHKSSLLHMQVLSPEGGWGFI